MTGNDADRPDPARNDTVRHIARDVARDIARDEAGPGEAGRPGGDRVERGAGRVWLCAQRSPLAQRRGRLVGESLAHPARMLPDLAAHAIAAYTDPGQVVLDPMCGIGTTLVEAVRAGRRAVGVELEPRWARIAEENLALARAEGHHADARIVRGDARALDRLLTEYDTADDITDAYVADRADVARVDEDAPSLVLTSPPYGSGVHGHITNARPGDPIVKYHHRYSTTRNRANLADAPDQLGAAMTAILRACASVLRPGGRVVVVSRPWRHRGVLVDLPGQMTTCATAAGLVLTDRAVALLARLDTDQTGTTGTTDTDQPTGEPIGRPAGERAGARLVARASFFARHNLRRARAAGHPVHLIAHEDVYVFTKPDPGGETARARRRRPEPDSFAIRSRESGRGWSQ